MTAKLLTASYLDRRLVIQRPAADDSLDGAGSGEWVRVDEVYANVQDMLPSKGERFANGINLATRPSRVRMRYLPGITPNMRFVLEEEAGDQRIMNIVSGPAEIGRREGLEFVVEDYTQGGTGD